MWSAFAQVVIWRRKVCSVALTSACTGLADGPGRANLAAERAVRTGAVLPARAGGRALSVPPARSSGGVLMARWVPALVAVGLAVLLHGSQWDSHARRGRPANRCPPAAGRNVERSLDRRARPQLT